MGKFISQLISFLQSNIFFKRNKEMEVDTTYKNKIEPNKHNSKPLVPMASTVSLKGVEDGIQITVG